MGVVHCWNEIQRCEVKPADFLAWCDLYEITDVEQRRRWWQWLCAISETMMEQQNKKTNEKGGVK